MKFVKIDPPGTHCAYEALRDVVKRLHARSFVDVGCGRGAFSKLLCSMGMSGFGIDFSPSAIETTSKTMRKEIDDGRYAAILGDVTSLDRQVPPVDIGLSLMVMEHVEDDVGFVRKLSGLVRPGGCVAICVPGRKDCWTFEDETVGHLRRYDRDDLRRVLQAGGLQDVEVWSVAVPTANLLLGFSAWLVRNSNEAKKVGLSQREQTEASGLQEIPWKTTFPPWVRLILNRHVLYPLLLVQRLFYRTNLGLTMLGFGRVPSLA
jgi:2-polyprenyl-3-methyl-5-hydroxy-6-metoxy-1,4-benzoquinol methylase